LAFVLDLEDLEAKLSAATGWGAELLRELDPVKCRLGALIAEISRNAHRLIKTERRPASDPSHRTGRSTGRGGSARTHVA